MAYRIIKDAEDHYQVMHPDGSRFTVPKKGISKQMHEKISGMPKLYDGGLMSDAELEQSAMIPKSAPSMPLDSDLASVQSQIDDAASRNDNSSDTLLPLYDKKEQILNAQKAMMEAPKMPSQKELEEMAPSKEIKYPEEKTPEAPKKEPLKDQEAKPIEGIDQTLMPQMQSPDYLTKFDPYASFRESQKAAKTLENAQLANQKMLDQNAADFETAKANDHKEMQNFIDTHQIKQGNYWGSMDTGGKVMAGLAMALGGIGAGMTGGPNYALQIINKAIEDDLDAQKENRNSGLTTLLQKGKDRDAVMANYRANLIQKVQDQNNLYTAQAKTADQKAAGQALDMKLQEMKNQYQLTADNRMTMNYLYRKGIPTKAIPFALLNDEKVRRQLVDVNGTSYFYKGGADGAEIHNKMEANYRPIKEGILRLQELGRSTLVPGTKAYEEAQALSQMLPNAVAGFYSAAIESKRISDTEGHRAEAALSNPTSVMQAIVGGNVRGMTALREMNGIVDSSRQQNLSGYDATPKPIMTESSGAQKLPLNKVK
jgi:hypothetical protein